MCPVPVSSSTQLLSEGSDTGSFKLPSHPKGSSWTTMSGLPRKELRRNCLLFSTPVKSQEGIRRMMRENSAATTPTSIISTMCLEGFCNCQQQQSESKLSSLSWGSNVKKAWGRPKVHLVQCLLSKKAQQRYGELHVGAEWTIPAASPEYSSLYWHCVSF